MEDLKTLALLGKAESIEELLNSMNADIYANLRTAVELGKWRDGIRLTPEQLQHCLQATILYEARYLPSEEQTVSQIPNSCAQQSAEES